MHPSENQPIQLSAEELRASVKNAFESPDWYFQHLNYRILLRTQLVAEWVRQFSFSRCMDIGCGDGSISLPLLQQGCRLTLQDLSEAMLAKARLSVKPAFREQVETVAGDFLQTSLSPAAYDLVISLGVVSYVTDLEAFVEKLAALVAPGGHVLIECTDAPHFMSRFSAAYSSLTALIRPHSVNIGLQAHSARALARAFDQRRFVLLDTYRYSVPLPLIRRFCSQRFHYRVNRLLHGPAAHNRLGWLGSECIFHYQRPAAPAGTPR
jgi:2-polyprenyl-3-methyl-5-hydroxy-6-metoxy-1,4-benzoquinol methylase